MKYQALNKFDEILEMKMDFYFPAYKIFKNPRKKVQTRLKESE